MKLIKKNINRLLKSLNISVFYGRSIKSYDNLKIIRELLERTLHLKGDIIEFGVYRGGITLFIGSILKKNNSNKILYSLDSFEGYKLNEFDKANLKGIFKKKYKNGRFSNTNYKKVTDIIKKNQLDNVHLIKGYFEKTLPLLNKKRFSYAFLDCDLPSSYDLAFKFLKKRMVKNGIIHFNNYSPDIWNKPCNLMVKRHFKKFYLIDKAGGYVIQE